MDSDVALKLTIAALLGGCIGVERQMHEKPAGFRTNILICVGSTLFMSISTWTGRMLNADPTRIAAQIITGIGFLGAGAVLHSHGFVMGLTTAATIWVVAGVGMAVGAGFYGIGLFATVLTVVTLTVMSYVEDRIQRRRLHSYTVTTVDVQAAMETIKRTLEESLVSPSGFNFRRDPERYQLWFTVSVSPELNLKIVERLAQHPEIIQLETGVSPGDFMQPTHPSGGSNVI